MLPVVLALAILAFPALSFASTYQFVDSSGNLQSVEAANSSVALATAYNIGVHSGVMLTRNGAVLGTNTYTTYTTNAGTGNYYQFVNTSGQLSGLWATNSSVALATAYNIGIHSGVVLVN